MMYKLLFVNTSEPVVIPQLIELPERILACLFFFLLQVQDDKLEKICLYFYQTHALGNSVGLN